MEYAEAMSQAPTTVTGDLSARLLDQLGVGSQGFSAACDLEPLAVPLIA